MSRKIFKELTSYREVSSYFIGFKGVFFYDR
nr:MAG TPA: hypothetical protein [Caudoviricetes sp.]